ncbi:phage major capsid protein [Sinorhizobium medicae]|uniref:phage major capsid protein n=1 Tax=Sinorhizobium medicae TaxID=110321 RepID=UPI000FDB693F|nr:phage major capsid protein [Sinorhizobium medicae]RVJ39193.1 phage major capsid protein [Sinorhizobium medicae]
MKGTNMTNIAHLQEKRAAKLEELRSAQNDDARFTAVEKEIASIDGEIRRAQKLDALDKAAVAPVDTSMQRELRSYSLAKAIKEGASGKLTGLEAEMSAELGKGREVRGFMVPTDAIFESRAQTVGTPSAGGYTVATNMGGLIDRLRPVLAVQGLGASVISGLVGNLDLPKLTGGPSAAWVAEDGPATASDSTFDKVSLSPKTVAGEMYMSRRLQLQNGVAIESILRNDLAFVLAQALDRAAIAGTGAANQPEGILTAVAEHATAATVLSDIAADLIGALEMDDVTGTTGFLTNSALLAAVRKIKDGNQRVVPQSEIFHGERVVSSNNVPQVAAENPLIFGAWSNLVIGYWSGVDILANPYSDASKGGLRLHAFLDADIAIRHEEAFAYKLVA